MAISYITKERVWVSFFLFILCLGLAQNVHKGYLFYETVLTAQAYDPQPMDHRLFTEQTTQKPEAYRVAMPALGKWTMRSFGIHDPAIVAAAFDLFSAMFACYLLYQVALEHLPATSSTGYKRLTIIALLLAFLQFPIAWVVPWQRPETLPSTLYLAAVLFSAQRLSRNRVWASAILALSATQAFVRSDVALVMGLALFLLGLLPSTKSHLAPRGVLLTIGSLVVIIAAGVQGYLQFIRFPHLQYRPGTDAIQLLNNLRSPHQLFNMMIALLPFLVVSILLLTTRRKIDPIDRLVLLAAGIYLLCYIILAVVGEVRVYVPFLFALCPVAAKCFATILDRNIADQSVPI